MGNFAVNYSLIKRSNVNQSAGKQSNANGKKNVSDNSHYKYAFKVVFLFLCGKKGEGSKLQEHRGNKSIHSYPVNEGTAEGNAGKYKQSY